MVLRLGVRRDLGVDGLLLFVVLAFFVLFILVEVLEVGDARLRDAGVGGVVDGVTVGEESFKIGFALCD